ncbi:MAG: hypothetical protein AVDCRST_MAG85-4273, partial [uncultured Solirubrobacteraceae bacterium]
DPLPPLVRLAGDRRVDALGQRRVRAADRRGMVERERPRAVLERRGRDV